MWALRGEAVQDHGDWDPPGEASYLDDDEKVALDNLIRAIARSRQSRTSSLEREGLPPEESEELEHLAERHSVTLEQGDVVSVPRADLIFRDGDQVMVVEVKEHASKATQDRAREQLRQSIEKLADSLNVRAVPEGSLRVGTQIFNSEFDIDLVIPTGGDALANADRTAAGKGSGKTAIFLAAYAHDLRNRLTHLGGGALGAAHLPLTETDELALDLIDSTPELLADALPAEDLRELQAVAARRHQGRTPGQQDRTEADKAGEYTQDRGGMDPA